VRHPDDQTTGEVHTDRVTYEEQDETTGHDVTYEEQDETTGHDVTYEEQDETTGVQLYADK